MPDVLEFPRGTLITPNGGGLSATSYAGEGFLSEYARVAQGGQAQVDADYPRGAGYYFSDEASGAWIARVEGYPTDFGIDRVTFAGPSCSLFPLRGSMAPAGFMVASFDGGYEPTAWGNRGRKVGLGMWTNYRVDRADDARPGDQPSNILATIAAEDRTRREETIIAIAAGHAADIIDAAEQAGAVPTHADVAHDAYGRTVDDIDENALPGLGAAHFDSSELSDLASIAVGRLARGEVNR